MKRVMICIILLSSLLFGCGKSSTEEPKPTQGEQRPVFTGTITPSTAPTPSIDPKASPTLTPIPDGKLLGWRLVESWSQVVGEVTIEKKAYDEENRLICVETIEKENGEEVLVSREEYQYDEQGNCVLESKWNQVEGKSDTKYRYEADKLIEAQHFYNDKINGVDTYQYLENGNVRRELHNSEDNALLSHSIFRTDEEGRTIECRSFLAEGDRIAETFQAEYCEFGLLWSRVEINLQNYGAETDNYPRWKSNIYLYDAEGKLLKKIEKSGDMSFGDPSRSEWRYRYEKGELVYEAYLDDYNIIRRQEEWRCIFDEDGRVLEKIRLNEDGTDTSHKKTYRYDDYGNCIEMIEQQGARKDVYRYVYEPVFAAD